MTERQRAVGIFDRPSSLEAALNELERSHYALDRVYLLARDLERENKIVNTKLCKSLRNRFDRPINVADSETVEDAIDLTKGLIHLDLPVDAANSYNRLVVAGKYLVTIEGNTTDIIGAETILKRHGVRDWTIYQIILEHPEVIIVDRRQHH